MRVLFCNIGWMKCYQGQSNADEIQDGGAYIQENGKGFEVCNFVDVQGITYGYVQPPRGNKPGEGTIRIEQIHESGKEFVSDVLVVWTARRPKVGTVVIGWYENATVYRQYQEFQTPPEMHKENCLTGYWVKAMSKDTGLLPVRKRTIKIPRGVKGGMGQANIWYAKSPPGDEVVSKVRKLINDRQIQQCF